MCKLIIQRLNDEGDWINIRKSTVGFNSLEKAENWIENSLSYDNLESSLGESCIHLRVVPATGSEHPTVHYSTHSLQKIFKLSREASQLKSKLEDREEEIIRLNNLLTPLKDSVNRLTSERSKMLRKAKRSGIKL